MATSSPPLATAMYTLYYYPLAMHPPHDPIWRPYSVDQRRPARARVYTIGYLRSP